MTKLEYQRQWREKNKEKVKTYQKEYQKKNRERIRLQVSEYGKEWYQKNRERKLALNSIWQNEHKAERVKHVQAYVRRNKDKVSKYNSKYGGSLAGFWRRYRHRAKKAGYEITITLQDFQKITDEPCKYCGENERQRGIDRVDNKKGYIIGNCVGCCGKCNMMKMKQTKEEFLRHIKKIYEHNA